MQFLQNLISTFWFEAIIRLILGFLLAGFIGAERESVNKPAGFKTHSLIGISSVLIMLCGEYLSYKYSVDASRIPAQLLSGIGFIGAGTILRDGFNVKGLTTASSLLATTCIGLSIGAGFYIGGIISTVIVYIILSRSHNLFESLDHFKNDINIKKIKTGKPNEEDLADLSLIFRYHKDVNINSVFTEISSMENVLDLEEG